MSLENLPLYRGWQLLGRQVPKGERAMKILGYSTKKITSSDPTPAKRSRSASCGIRCCPCSTRYPEIR
jgi:hypothetical protein